VATASAQPPDVDAAVLAACDWLVGQQSADGGWGERLGDKLSPLNTAEAVLALLQVRDRLPRALTAIARGVRFIESLQLSGGDDDGAWAREADGQLLPDVVRTGVIVEALADASPAEERPSLAHGVGWLLRVQAPATGGWAFRRGEPAEVLPTCFALSGLLAAYRSDVAHAQAIAHGLAFIADRVDSVGAVGEADALQAVRTAYAAFCLQRATSCGLNVHHAKEVTVIAWLNEEKNRLKAIQEAELVVPVGPDRDPAHGDYTFVFMTEALVLRVLSGADPARRSGPLATSALQMLWTGRDESTGGFYGRRRTSWATARAVHALSASRVSTVPPPRRTVPPVAPHLMLGLVVLLAAAVVVLSLAHDLGAISAVVLSFLALVALVGYGLISESVFASLVTRLLGSFGRSSGSP
jgi:hypothetical protein